MNSQVLKPISEKAEQKKKVGEIIETIKIITKKQTQAELNEELFQEIYDNRAPSKEKKEYTKIKELVKAGADINAFDDKWHGETPLMSAAVEGNIDLVKVLLELGANVNTNKKKYDNVLYYLCSNFLNGCYPEHYEIVNELIKNKVNVNMADNHGCTPLMLNVMYGGLFIRELIKAGANVNVTDNMNNSILDYAVDNDSMEDIIDLINAGVKVEERAILTAANNGKLEFVKVLKKRKKVQDKINKKLLTAFENEQMDLVKEYLKEGANIDTKYKNGWTPLMYAVANNETYLVKQLINLGADIYIKDKNNLSPLDIAKMSNFEDMEMEKILTDKIKKENPKYLEENKNDDDDLPF